MHEADPSCAPSTDPKADSRQHPSGLPKSPDLATRTDERNKTAMVILTAQCSGSPSELLPGRGGGPRGRGQCFCVFGGTPQLPLPGMCAVPVSGRSVVVPDGGRLRIAEVAGLACVVCRVDE